MRIDGSIGRVRCEVVSQVFIEVQKSSPNGIEATRLVEHQVKSHQGPSVRQVLQVS